ncbi:MAG TPA: 2-amino-4-hydroxy-6-hydroxymethyldihydropteridine diphosphokinase, partial [Pirellulales bacterium]|nr:2-amino-4-hydroxy-6-hydroxymethyldihydropteridine diphosphokinase [Pirellulales bacterium]
MACVLLSLGSNLGDRPAQLARALEVLCSSADCSLLRRSRWYRTQSVGGPPDQPAFLNGAAVVETALSPQQLHARLLAVEVQLGRRRDVRWGSRTIDLDLLLYGTQVIETAELILPHPRMCVRRFVLVPAAEIAADWIHPALGWTLGRLLGHLDTAAPYLAITGPPAAGKSALAEILAHECGAALLRDPAVEPLIAALDDGGSSRGLPSEEQLIANRQRVLAAIEPGRSIRFV